MPNLSVSVSLSCSCPQIRWRGVLRHLTPDKLPCPVTFVPQASSLPLALSSDKPLLALLGQRSRSNFVHHARLLSLSLRPQREFGREWFQPVTKRHHIKAITEQVYIHAMAPVAHHDLLMLFSMIFGVIARLDLLLPSLVKRAPVEAASWYIIRSFPTLL